MKDKALNTILEYGMFSRGDRLLVACSGGADSVCLLHFLCGLRKSWDIKVSAIHLNHNLRGDESVRDENFVRELCTNWDVPLTVLTADIAALAKQAGESAELCGRRVRYEMFGQKAASLSAKLAVAHTLDDNAETVLLNLIRGTGLRGLGGIPPVRGDIVRPLIRCARTDVEAYLEAHGLSYVTDSTNATDAYTRNRVRKNIMPLLAAENPRFLGHMDGMTRQIREDADFLDGLAEEAAKSIIRDTGRYDRAGFLALPGPVSSRVLAGILKCAGITCERDTISRLFNNLHIFIHNYIFRHSIESRLQIHLSGNSWFK